MEAQLGPAEQELLNKLTGFMGDPNRSQTAKLRLLFHLDMKCLCEAAKHGAPPSRLKDALDALYVLHINGAIENVLATLILDYAVKAQSKERLIALLARTTLDAHYAAEPAIDRTQNLLEALVKDYFPKPEQSK